MLIEKAFNMHMSVKNAEGRMKLLPMERNLLLWTNGFLCVTENLPNGAVRNVLFRKRYTQLRARHEQD